jgi:hypothetical protein
MKFKTKKGDYKKAEDHYRAFWAWLRQHGASITQGSPILLEEIKNPDFRKALIVSSMKSSSGYRHGNENLSFVNWVILNMSREYV